MKHKISLCKIHYNEFIGWEESHKFEIKMVPISECYYCEQSRENSISLDSVITNYNSVTDDDCVSGVCPVR